jgi:hypothetical protein
VPRCSVESRGSDQYSRHLNAVDAQRAEGYAVPDLGHGMRRVTLGSRRRLQSGQTTTEWLMVAGVLTTVALLFLNLFPSTLRVFLRAAGIAVRTAAP